MRTSSQQAQRKHLSNTYTRDFGTRKAEDCTLPRKRKFKTVACDRFNENFYEV